MYTPEAIEAVTIAKIKINELNSAYVEGTIVDEQGLPVPKTSVSAFEMTRTQQDGTVITAASSILDTNGGTYHATSGLFTLTLGKALQTLIGTVAIGQRQTQYVLLVLTWGSTGRWSGKVELQIAKM